jgi:hypothetical protein
MVFPEAIPDDLSRFDVVAVLNALRVSWNPGSLTDYHDRG